MLPCLHEGLYPRCSTEAASKLGWLSPRSSGFRSAKKWQTQRRFKFAFLFYGVKTIEASCPGLPVKFPELALWKERPTRRLESVWVGVGGIFRAGLCFFPRFGKLFGFPAVSEPTSEPRISNGEGGRMASGAAASAVLRAQEAEGRCRVWCLIRWGSRRMPRCLLVWWWWRTS